MLNESSPAQTLNFIWHWRPPWATAIAISSTAQCTCRTSRSSPFCLLQPSLGLSINLLHNLRFSSHLISPKVWPQLVQPVPILCQLTLFKIMMKHNRAKAKNRTFYRQKEVTCIDIGSPSAGFASYTVFIFIRPSLAAVSYEYVYLYIRYIHSYILKFKIGETCNNVLSVLVPTWDIFAVSSSSFPCSFFLRWFGGSSL